MGLQFSITAIGTIIVQSAVNIYGPVHMAGFSAAGKIQNIFATVFTAFGATIATYVGQNRGAGKMDRVKQGVRYTQMMVLGWSVFVMFLMFFLRKISDISFRRSIGTGRSKCVCYLFPDSILGISVSRKYFPLSKYSAGNGIWTCTNAWRGI